MKKIIILLILFSAYLQAKLPKLDALVVLPTLDVEHELNEDAKIASKDRPLRYAVAHKVGGLFLQGEKNQGGQWNQLSDDTWVWRVMLNSENAKSLDFGLTDFFMPPTAQLSFYDWSGELAKGPYNDQKNTKNKQLWTGPIIGDVVTIELKVSQEYKDYVSFSVDTVSQGYKSIWQEYDLLPSDTSSLFWQEQSLNKSGSCNVDVVCEDGDGWRDQIRSVAQYVFTKSNGSFVCTGTMLNNASENSRSLFLTANHCISTNTVANTISMWWNYESSQCRAAGSSASGTRISKASFNDTQSGSSLKATNAASDFTLLELDNVPNASYNVFYSGWDAQDAASNMAVGIHHPQGHAKRISFENNPTTITSYSSSASGSRTHIRIADWDVGTTEGGSSGSGLWNGNKLLIGQLHGGAAACGNNSPDWYGRLYKSWEGGGTASSRLKDWLDPNNTGIQLLQGLGDDSCPNMNVTINQQSTNEKIGVAQNYSATISGGFPPYKYQWDINADEQIDGTSDSISATYASQFSDNVTVKITDSNDCTGSGTKAVVIKAPKINLTSTGAVAQLCGNNDAIIDAGERWRVLVRMQNNGFADTTNAYAVFNKVAAGASVNITASDNYGNGVGSCAREFIDISATGTELGFVDSNPGDEIPANDDGAAIVKLSQPFNFYGQSISELAVSSNGYLSVNSSDTGVDFDNDCPLPIAPNNTANGSTTQARILPLHDDLIVQHLYHQHFTTCPRQSALGDNLSCDIFMYKDVDLYDNTNTTVEHFNFEAILYPTVNQWVYQYDGDDIRFASSSIGIQNNNATDGVGFSCNNADTIDTSTAVCVYHKDFQGENTGSNDVSFYNLETPVLALGNLGISQNKNAFVEFSVSEDAPAGAQLNISMQAAVYENGFNFDGSSILSKTLGNNPVNNCNASADNDITPTNGLWYNANRSGNGNDMYFGSQNLTYLQYTALEDRSPIWYITGGGYYQNNQAYNDLLKISYNGPFLSSAQTATNIGNSVTTVIDSNHAIQTRTINGKFSADLLETFIFSADITSQQRTGLWYNQSESGWGQSIGTQGDIEVVVSYLYDNVGQPYWLLGAGSNNNNTEIVDIDLGYSNAFCPHCPKMTLQTRTVGSVKIEYNSNNTTATMQSMQVDVEGEHAGQWNRTNLPLIIIPIN